MTETLSPPACRCGDPSTRSITITDDGEPIGICDRCYFREYGGYVNELQPMPIEQPQPNDPLSMAIRQGMDAGSITQIVALLKDREADEARKLFSKAMVAAQSEMPVVIKSGKNSQTNSSFAMLEDVQRVCKPVYSRHGFALSFSEGDSPVAGWKRTLCNVRHVGGHAETHFVDLPLDGFGAKGAPIGNMNPVQAAVSTGSYGHRVLLARIFNLTLAGTDKDGQSLQDVLLITPEQLSDLKDLITQNETDEAKLLKWLGAPALDQITRTQFEKFRTTYMQRKGAKS